jgi:Zn-dependent protease with chaperone function
VLTVSLMPFAKTAEVCPHLFCSGAATFMNLLSTHPPIEERIRLLQAMRA